MKLINANIYIISIYIFIKLWYTIYVDNKNYKKFIKKKARLKQ